jgi:hypothetical protein
MTPLLETVADTTWRLRRAERMIPTGSLVSTALCVGGRTATLFFLLSASVSFERSIPPGARRREDIRPTGVVRRPFALRKPAMRSAKSYT